MRKAAALSRPGAGRGRKGEPEAVAVACGAGQRVPVFVCVGCGLLRGAGSEGRCGRLITGVVRMPPDLEEVVGWSLRAGIVWWGGRRGGEKKMKE